jgi:mRNA-degrading endonuclease toxin of MazEF toxin-antitoxin module
MAQPAPITRTALRTPRAAAVAGILFSLLLGLGLVLITISSPANPSARPASFRPEINVLGEKTRVLVEQVGAIDAGRLGDLVGRVSPEQQWGIDEALLTVLGLR